MVSARKRKAGNSVKSAFAISETALTFLVQFRTI